MMKKNVLTLMAAALLCAGLAACGDKKESNPLDVEAPAWQQFAHPTVEMPKIYKEASADSPVLKRAFPTGNTSEFKVWRFWSGEKFPRGWFDETWFANETDAFPILGEEGDFYKVYVFNVVSGAAEGYVKKSDYEAVTPVELTQELIDSIGRLDGRCDYVVKEGELRNLCFSSFPIDVDEEPHIMVGQLCGNSIVYTDASVVRLNVVAEKAPITFAKTEGGEGYTLTCGKDQFFEPSPSHGAILDTRKLGMELMQQMYNSLKSDSAKVKEVLYYIPGACKDRFVKLQILPTDNTEDVEAEQIINDDPKAVVSQIIECAMARDMEGLRELMTGTPREIQETSTLFMMAFSVIKGYNITKCEINGNRARVRYSVELKYGTEKDKMDLVKTADGSWKLVAGK